MLKPGTVQGVWPFTPSLAVERDDAVGSCQHTARWPAERQGRTREGLAAAIPPSPSGFAQKGCQFPATRALLLDHKSVFSCLKIEHV